MRQARKAPPSRVLLLLALCAWPFPAAAQPIDLPIGTMVVVVFGEGTAIPDGTRMKAKLTGYDEEGVRFRVDKQRYYVKWSHIRSVKPLRAPSAAPRPKPAAEPVEEEAVPPPAHARPEPAADAANALEAASPSSYYRPEPETRARRAEPGERYGWRDPLPRRDWKEEPERKLQRFFELDFFGADGAGDGIRDDVQEGLDSLGSGSASITTKGAVGARAGLLTPWPGVAALSWGGSLGFIGGPDSSYSGTASGVAFNGTRSARFWRALVQAEARYTMNERWNLLFGMGLGVVQGTLNQSFACPNPALCTSTTDSRSYAGFTWEISPGIARRFESFELTASLRYAGFPTAAETGKQSKLSWKPLVFTVGARF